MPKITLLKRNKPKEIVTVVRHEKRDKMLKTKLNRYHAYDISEAIMVMTTEERLRLYKYISQDKMASVFEHISDEKGAEFILELDRAEGASLLTEMEIDDAVDILQHLKYEDSTELLLLVDESKRDAIYQLSKYKHQTAGSEMNSEFIKLDAEMDIKDAMKKMVSLANEVELIDTLFVTDEENSLIGVIDLKDLIVAKHPVKIKDIMNTNFYAVHVLDGIQEVVRDIQKYDTLAMPVLNGDGKIEGVITMYDAMDIIEETAHDDYAKLAGLPTEDDVYDTARQSAKKRFPWLALLLFLNIIVSTVLASYEETIAAIAVLVLFQPMILDMSGNIGTQSLAVTILRISRETLRTRVNVIQHLISETMIGVVNGMILGFLSFLTSWFLLTLLPIGEVGGAITPIRVAIIVGVSIFSALSVSSFLGSAIPMILNKLKVDPAVASGPFITTINDVTALMVYFGLASAFLMALL